MADRVCAPVEPSVDGLTADDEEYLVGFLRRMNEHDGGMEENAAHCASAAHEASFVDLSMEEGEDPECRPEEVDALMEATRLSFEEAVLEASRASLQEAVDGTGI